MKNSDAHVIIVGAGPAGSSCAISLRSLGCKVTLIDSGKADKFHIGENISPDMNPVLKSLGVYDEFIKLKISPCYGTCSYWGSDLRGYNDYVLSPYGHGWHLDRNEFDKLLLNAARQRGAKVEINSTFRKVTINAEGVTATIQNAFEKTIHLNGDFIVDASGSRSAVSACLGNRVKNDTSLICLARRYNIENERQMDYLTHLESVEHGWWYAARIPDNTLLVSFYTTADVARNLKVNKIDNWTSLLEDAPETSEIALAMQARDSHILGYSTHSFCLDQITGEKWAAIGDAASTYDPVMAKGILKSVTNGMNVAPAIFDYLKTTDQAGLVQFENLVKEEYEAYKMMRGQLYYLENRWPESDFWKRMQGKRESVSV